MWESACLHAYAANDCLSYCPYERGVLPAGIRYARAVATHRALGPLSTHSHTHSEISQAQRVGRENIIRQPLYDPAHDQKRERQLSWCGPKAEARMLLRLVRCSKLRSRTKPKVGMAPEGASHWTQFRSQTFIASNKSHMRNLYTEMSLS